MGLSNPLDEQKNQPKTIDPVLGAVVFLFSGAGKCDFPIDSLRASSYRRQISVSRQIRRAGLQRAAAAQFCRDRWHHLM